MASITLRSTKGSPLTITEMDNNFSNINLELGTKVETTTYTATDILTKLKTVDGSGSGLDADLLDGSNADSTNVINTIVKRDLSGNFAANVITADLVGDVTGNVSGNLTGNVTGNVTGNILGTGTISGTGIVAILNGGTNASSTTQALNNLLPTNRTSGYVLKTGGTGNYYWAAETGASVPQGTRIESQREIFTATSNQTLFTLASATYVPGSNQLRVYIDGVRQFDSEYTETSTSSFTLSSGVSAGAVVLVEIDGNIEYQTQASEVTFSPVGNISSTDVQDAIAELDTEKASAASLGTMSTQNANAVNVSGGTVTGLTTFGVGGSWTVVQSGNDLLFKYAGTNKMRLDSSGNLTVSGNVTAFGTV